MEGWVDLDYTAVHKPGTELDLSITSAMPLPLHHRVIEEGAEGGTWRARERI